MVTECISFSTLFFYFFHISVSALLAILKSTLLIGWISVLRENIYSYMYYHQILSPFKDTVGKLKLQHLQYNPQTTA